MKKRLLSFLLACFMVVSTFIISRPIADVYAVENDVPTYTLPDVLNKAVDESGSPDANGNLAVNGHWSARVYDSIATRTPLPASTHTYCTDTRWVYSVNGLPFNAFDSNTGNDAKVYVNPDSGVVPVIVFTAPEAGIYYFDEDISHILHVTTAGNKTIGVNFLVYNGDKPYANLFSSGPDAKDGNLTGYVALEKGEELLFVAERAFGVPIGSFSGDDWYYAAVNGGVSGAYINDIVVKKVAELPEGHSDVVYHADFFDDGQPNGEYVDGQFRLAGFDRDKNAPIEISSTGIDETYPTNPSLTYTAGSSIVWKARHDMGLYTTSMGAVVFTAPAEGYYALSIDAYQVFAVASNQNFWLAEIIDSNRRTLSKSETYFESDASIGESKGAYFTTAASTYLEEGEEIYFVIRYPGAFGHSGGFKNVSAVYLGTEGIPMEEANTWYLPMNWNYTGTFDSNNWELAQIENWRLTTFADPTDISTMRDGGSKAKIMYNAHAPESYIETRHNRSILSPTADNADWYINITKRWDGNKQPMHAGDNSTYMVINPQPTGVANNPAVVFTAPEDGLYSYSELVTATVFEKVVKNTWYPNDETKDTVMLTPVTAAVRKNGELINAFVPVPGDPTRTLEGTVSLKKGDLLMFVFTLNADSFNARDDKFDPIRLGETVVRKIGEYVEEPAGTDYVLPMNWATGLDKDDKGWDITKKGEWRLACMVDPALPDSIVSLPSETDFADAIKGQSNVGPIPYIESTNHRVVLAGESNFTNWYISGLRRWESGKTFDCGDNASFIQVSPISGYSWVRQPSAIFTAPEDGLYSYSSFISRVMFTDLSGVEFDAVATIRKNGRVINSFAPTADNASKLLEGTVELKKGDVFTISFRNYMSPNVSTFSHVFTLGDTVLKKIGSAYNGITVDHTPIFDGTSLTDISGNVKLWAYNTDTGEFYDTTASGDVRMELSADGTTWYAYNPLGTNNWEGGGPKSNYIWSGTVNGPINMSGGSLLTKNVGFAIIFTAPYDGMFEVNADLGSAYPDAGSGRYHISSILLGDGTVLASESNRGKKSPSVDKLSATVSLKKGEEIIILKTPDPKTGEYNITGSGDSSISIKEVNHVCNAGTVEHVTALEAGCEDGNVEYYACACGLNYSDANATQLLENAAIPGTGHSTGSYEADQSKHWKHCADCGEDVYVQAHTWADGVCTECEYACSHDWNGDNVCDNCGYDRTVDLAEESFNNALDNYFNGGNNAVSSVGPTASLDRFKVTRPSGSVTGLEYKLFNLRFEGGEIILRHHFIVTGDIALYTFTVNGEKITPVNAGADIYYFETVLEAGKLHEPDVITVKKGSESVDFAVSGYSYIAIALEQSTDEKVNDTLKSLYDLNEALYTESGDRALLEITVEGAEITTFASDRTYDPAKEDITLILVVGQSNFTKSAGFAWEFSHHYFDGKAPAPPESPLIPDKGTVFSFNDNATSFVLNDAADMHYLSSPFKRNTCIGGISPVFGTRWYELTGNKVVFVQAAEGSTSVDEWVPDPENYVCGCDKNGQAFRYSKAVTAYTNAYNALSADYNIVLSGYIWNQGESDEKDKPEGATVNDDQSYYDAYLSMHEGFMSELDLDFGGISVVRSHFSGESAEGSASYTKARYAQYKLCNDLDDLYMLSTVSETCSLDMMDQGNPVHYSQKIFNVMGVDMANNLFSCLGLGTANAFDGIKLLSKDGKLLTHIDENGDVVLGSNVINAENTSGRILIKLSALGREDAVSYKLTIGGIDCSQYIDAFGLIDWETLEAETGMDSLKVVVNYK